MKLFLENMPWPVWVTTVDSKIMFLNKKCENLFRIKLKDIRGKVVEQCIRKEIFGVYDKYHKACVKNREVLRSERLSDGRYLECIIFPLINDQDDLLGVAGVVLDINERKEKDTEVEKQKDILRTIIDALPEVVFYKDKDSRFIGYNKSFETYYRKLQVNNILGKTDLEIYPDKEIAKEFLAHDKEVMNKKKVKYFEQTMIRPDGSIRIEENIKIPVIGKEGEIRGVVGLSRDITEKKTFEDRLRYLSETDTLTGLYNRYSFEEKVKYYNTKDYLPLGIIMGDVNGLKLVNDTLGHLEGDRLLKDIANVLRDTCEGKGAVFRWGGDEFMILLPNCNEEICEAVVEEIVEAFKAYDDHLIHLSMALGGAVKYTLEEDVYNYIQKIEEKVYRQKLLDKKSVKSSILNTLIKSLEEKSMETNEHATRIVNYALEIGKQLDFKMDELDELALSAQLHDIGKISISEEILLKSGRLTEEEYEIIKTHTEKGYRIIQACGELSDVAKNVLTHHERWDGKGYPVGLKGQEIPLMARIISIVDAYDVMTHERVYKKAMKKEDAIEELTRCSGLQFDPYLIDVFINQVLISY